MTKATAMKRQQRKSGQGGTTQHHTSIHTQANPRSAAEADTNSGSKYRQLPCKTFISVGTCPFGERCVFLHDPRLICSTAHSITRQKNKEDNAGDTLFWPVTSGEVSSRNLEHNFHPYAVPVPQNDQYRLHDQALYSLWNHYVEFCRANSKMQHKMANAGPILEDASTVFTPRDVPINAFTHCQRLPVFQLLSSSNGETILPQQFALATHNELARRNVPITSVKSAPREMRLSPTSIAARSRLSDMQQYGDDYQQSWSGHTSYCTTNSSSSLSFGRAMVHEEQQEDAESLSSLSSCDEEEDLAATAVAQYDKQLLRDRRFGGFGAPESLAYLKNSQQSQYAPYQQHQQHYQHTEFDW